MNDSEIIVVNRLKKTAANSQNNTEYAENTAISAFAFLAGEPEYFSRFASLTGINPADISQIAGSHDFLAAVLQFFLSDDSLLLSFCQSADCPPEDVNSAYFRLAGPDAVS